MQGLPVACRHVGHGERKPLTNKQTKERLYSECNTLAARQEVPFFFKGKSIAVSTTARHWAVSESHWQPTGIRKVLLKTYSNCADVANWINLAHHGISVNPVVPFCRISLHFVRVRWVGYVGRTNINMWTFLAETMKDRDFWITWK
jgi:hypothetical protein